MNDRWNLPFVWAWLWASTINLENTFDRKNYFYADLPKGYQITQDRQPVCVGGVLKIASADGEKAIRIHHIHMEEDAGKSIHDQDPTHTLVDLNRGWSSLARNRNRAGLA